MSAKSKSKAKAKAPQRDRPATVKPSRATVAYVDPGEWAAAFGISLRNLWLYDVGAAGRLFHRGGEIRKHCPSGGLVASRNSIAANFLDQTDAEWLFVVDSDMGFAADTMERLIASAEAVDAGVMGALCFGILAGDERPNGGVDSRIVPTIYQWMELETEAGFSSILNYPVDQVQRVSATGSACLVIRRRVLEKVRANLGSDTWYHPVTHPTGGEGGGPRDFSEDLSFCVKVAQVGESIYVDSSVKTTHAKGPYALDETLYQRERAALGEVDDAGDADRS